ALVGMVGLGSYVLATHTEKKMNEMYVIIEAIRMEIQKEIKELKEKSGSQSTVVASLQALSQTYLGYLANREVGDTESKE
ncbi:hypothetical protein ACFLWX_01680, partial [Chloroflexota bacterium]